MNLEDFERKLTLLDLDYEVLSPLGGSYLHLRFTGPYDNKMQIWNCHLYTLSYYMHEILKIGSSPQLCRQFIHVGDLHAGCRNIEIGLHLPCIDTPAVKKTIIMVRQYKNLAYGRYEYGETLSI